MIDECTEFRIWYTLNNLLLEEYLDKVTRKKTYKDLEDFSDLKIAEESRNLIKVQLRALGLICLSTKRTRSTKDTNTYWTLTPYGDYVMTQLFALSK